MTVSKSYLDQARKLLQGSYNAKIQAYKNALNESTTGYNNQLGTTKLAYDNQVKNNIAGTLANENSFANNKLASGLGRSTIATSGVEGIGLQGKDAEKDINLNRQNAVNTINSNIQLANKNYNNNLAALNSENQSDILNQAMQLQSAAQAAAEKRAAARAKAAKATKLTSADNKAALVSYYKDVAQGGSADARKFLEDNKLDIVSANGGSNTLYNQLWDDYLAKAKRESQARAGMYSGLQKTGSNIDYNKKTTMWDKAKSWLSGLF